MAKSRKVWVTRLVVEGSGTFPHDMLRYDSCCPATEEDACLLDPDHREMRRVTLRRFAVNTLPATARRWESFGWRVVLETEVES